MRSSHCIVAALLALGAAGCSGRDAAQGDTETAAVESSSPVAAGEASASSSPQWTVDYGASRLGFSATQNGAAFEGEFEKFDAKIAFDPEDPADASIDVTIDMTSAATGDKQRDSALPGSDWFKAKEFPTARYVADRVVKNSDGSYVAEGELTMRGMSRPVALPFALAVDGNVATAHGEVTLVRTDFGVGQGEFADDSWVGLEVKVSVAIEASR